MGKIERRKLDECLDFTGCARGGMADTPDLGSGSVRIGGSSPLARTILTIALIIKEIIIFWKAAKGRGLTFRHNKLVQSRLRSFRSVLWPIVGLARIKTTCPSTTTGPIRPSKFCLHSRA